MSVPYQLRLSGNSRVTYVFPLNDTIDYYDLTFLFSGELHYVINGEPVHLTSGDAIFIPCKSHRVRMAQCQPTHYFSFNFWTSPEVLPQLPVHIPDCVNVILKEQILLFEKMKKDRSETLQEQKESTALQLILLLLQEALEKTTRSPHVNRILQYIQAHYTEPISLQEIAEHVYLTVPYCCNLFKKEMGCTIYETILKERLLLAQEYILRGDKPLKEIPYLCGFQDYGHFSKYFKKFTGYLPSRYKDLEAFH